MSGYVRWGFIGCGKVVNEKSGQAFQNIKNSEIYAIMRRDIRMARDSSEKFGSHYYYDSVNKLLSNSGVDAVYISTPPGLHYEQAMLCCDAKKATYIEKPFARNYTEACKLVAAFRDNNVPLFVAHYRRALPRFIEIKNIIESGEIGKPVEVAFRMTRIYDSHGNENTWLFNPVLSGGGKFFDIAPHTIDILVYLFGNFVEVSGTASKVNNDHLVEDIVVLSFKTETGVIGTANFNSSASVKSDKMTVFGTSGSMEFSIHASDIVTVRSFKGERVFEIESPVCNEEPLIETIVNELLGFGVCPSKGADALLTVKIIDEVLDSFYGGRQRDFWNYPESWNRQSNMEV